MFVHVLVRAWFDDEPPLGGDNRDPYPYSDSWYRIIEYRPCPRGLETSPPILKWRQERAQSLSVIPRIQSLHMYV